MDILKKIEKDLQANSSKYRAKPFWAWNGKLDPGELRRQIRVMHKMGLGGFFMHSRVGLDTPYLSDQWFECIEACIDEANKLDMEAWLYDEDRWPSGAAGGLVTKNPEFRMRAVECEILSSTGKFKLSDDVIAVFTAKIDGAKASDVQRIPSKTNPKLTAGRKLLVFRVVITAPNDWYNGETYLDTMNPKAVEKFVEVTHAEYEKRFGKDFGKTIPGIFTDEPHHGSTFSHCQATNNGNALPWTGALPKTFKQRYGYDILDHIVELQFEVEGVKKINKVKHNYHDCVTHLFTQAFGKVIFDWCEKTGMMQTGHVLYESALSAQAHVVGSAMRFYEYMQAPGMDLLTEFHREFDTAKQVASAARQFGRKWRLTETYGCTGWQFPFVGHKAIGDWQLALGINLRCQHLYWYTMEGEAKRDYPASIAHQSPWWEIYSKVEDYFANAHNLMTRGDEVRDLLVIHPIESTWSIFNAGWQSDKDIKRLDQSLVQLRDSLLGANIDFDYGDEDILARHAKIVKSKGRVKFKVGKAAYTTILVPPMLTMRSSTLELLRKFKQAGGKVVFAGKAAGHVDVIESKDVIDFAKTCDNAPAKGAELADAVENCRRVSITDAKGVEIPDTLYLLREDKDAWYLFVCNFGTDYTKAKAEVPVVKRNSEFADVRISGFEGANLALETDLGSGEFYTAKTVSKNDGIEIRTSLPQIGSRLFVVPKKANNKISKKLTAKLELKNVSKRTLKKSAWDFSLSESNNLVLDRPAYRIGKGGWRKSEEILRVDFAVRDSLKIKHRGGQMIQPWMQERSDNPKTVPVELAYRFDVKDIPVGEMFVCIERPELYRILINGNEIAADNECGWWVDKSLRRVAFPASMLVQGENELRLISDYNEYHPGFEIVYLLGNFGVKLNKTNVSLVSMSDKISTGDWTRQGLPFYSGAVSYRTNIKANLKTKQRLFLKVPSYEGTAVRVWVDGKPAGVIAWQPNELDITDFLTDNSAEIAIEVFSHRANSHGPLHLNDKLPGWIGPFEFITKDSRWKDSYRILPCGLMGNPELIVKQ